MYFEVFFINRSRQRRRHRRRVAPSAPEPSGRTGPCGRRCHRFASSRRPNAPCSSSARYGTRNTCRALPDRRDCTTSGGSTRTVSRRPFLPVEFAIAASAAARTSRGDTTGIGSGAARESRLPRAPTRRQARDTGPPQARVSRGRRSIQPAAEYCRRVSPCCDMRACSVHP